MKNLTQKIYQCLQSLDAPVSEKNIKRIVSGRNQKKVKALRDLVESGQIIRSGAGRKANPFLYSVKKSFDESVLSSHVCLNESKDGSLLLQPITGCEEAPISGEPTLRALNNVKINSDGDK